MKDFKRGKYCFDKNQMEMLKLKYAVTKNKT